MRELPSIARDFLEARVRALRRAVVADLGDLNRLIAHVLRGGVLVSVGVLIAGMTIATLEGAGYPTQTLGPEQLLAPLFRLRPAALLSFGVLLLILTPVVRVALSLFAFAKVKDQWYVVITGLVLLNLLTALLLGAV